MAPTGWSRGHATYFDGELWRFADDSSPCPGWGGYERACVKCDELPTPEGFDACLGKIDGATSACCGHGVLEAMVMIATG